MMLSIPFAWKVHETKIQKAIREKECNTKTCKYILMLLKFYNLELGCIQLLKSKKGSNLITVNV